MGVVSASRALFWTAINRLNEYRGATRRNDRLIFGRKNDHCVENASGYFKGISERISGKF